MGRIIALTAVGAFALVALLYGVVLNGFELFGPSGNGTALSPNSPPREITVRSDPAATPPQAAVPKTNRADRVEPAGEPESDVAEKTGAAARAPMRVARDVTPPNVLTRPTSPYREPVPEEEKVAEEEPNPVRRYHRVVVRDASTLESGGVTIRFAGIAPIPADKTCTDEAGRDWPCGRVAAGALRMLIRHRAIDCAVISQTEGEIAGTCSAGLRDINGWLVAQGWAEVSSGADYAEEANAARAEKRGIYLAEWKPKGPGGSGAVSLTAFTAPTLPPDAYPGAPSATLAQGAVEGARDQGTRFADPIKRDE